MQLTRHDTRHGPRWALDCRWLPPSFSAQALLELERSQLAGWLQAAAAGGDAAEGALLAPIDDHQEVWASGVTYQRSREARRAESHAGSLYDLVYEAERPELFFKSSGWRAVGHTAPIRIRRDSAWNVPEPELVLVINRHQEIIGCCAGNDISSRSIEGENPLYLPQAKMYNGACALGPGIRLWPDGPPANVDIQLTIRRAGQGVFSGATSTSRMKRTFSELAGWLFKEMDFPAGVFLMTGTGLVPADDFTLQPGDTVTIDVGGLALENTVAG